MMKATELSLSIRQTIIGVEWALDIVRGFLLRHQVLDSKVFQICVCIAEILNNVVEHGERNGECSIGIPTIALVIHFKPPFILVEISHRGTAYDPKARAQHDAYAMSGRGLSIVTEWMDAYEYAHNNGFNKVVLQTGILLENETC